MLGSPKYHPHDPDEAPVLSLPCSFTDEEIAHFFEGLDRLREQAESEEVAS